MDANKILVKYGYDRHAKKVGGYRPDVNHDKILRKLATSLKPKARILDIGCGGGIPIAKFFSEKGFDVVGIDISEEQIKFAKRNAPKAKFFVMDAASLEFPTNSFDVIVSFDSLYHVDRREHAKIINKFSDVLDDNGTLAITLPIMAREETRYMFEDILMYWSHYGEKRNIDMILDAGFIPYHKEKYSPGNIKQIIVLAEKAVITNPNSGKHILYSAKTIQPKSKI